MSSDGAAFGWIQVIISGVSIAATAVITIMAKAFKSGRKESQFEGQDKLFENMITNVIKQQVAYHEEFKRLCEKVNDNSIRITRLETRQETEDRERSRIFKYRDDNR